MSKVYIITSGKGGVGKTTTVANLGAALNKFKEDVVIVDTNLTTPNIGLHFGAPIVPISLNHVLQGKASIDEAIYEHESGTKIVPSSLSLKDLKKVKLDNLYDAAKQLKKMYNHVIFDSAAGLGEEVKAAMESCDEVIAVTNPNILSVTDALKTIKMAKDMGKPVRGVIVSRVTGDKNEMSLESIHEMLEVPILGIVPEDKNIIAALNKKDAIVNIKPRSKSAKAYLDIAAKLLGKKKRPASFFRNFLNIFGLIKN
ncbi:MAG: cell division ATPase MinD [Candidatus Pacearchaeota archaeon]